MRSKFGREAITGGIGPNATDFILFTGSIGYEFEPPFREIVMAVIIRSPRSALIFCNSKVSEKIFGIVTWIIAESDSEESFECFGGMPFDGLVIGTAAVLQIRGESYGLVL